MEGVKNVVLLVIVVILFVSKGISVLKNVLNLFDVFIINEVFKYLNVDVFFVNDEVIVNVIGEIIFDVFFEYVCKMCVFIVVMGLFLVCIGLVCVVLFGGCVIGLRLVDLYLKGFEVMGVIVKIENGYIEVIVEKLVGVKVYLDFLSVGVI